VSASNRFAVTPRARWRRGLWLWGPPTIYAAAIFASSSLSAVPAPPPHFTDKHVHLLAYAGLALLLIRAFAGGRWSAVTVATLVHAALITVAYGVTDEWHQSFVPGRDADLRDVVADALGATLAVGAVGILVWWSRRSHRADGTIEQAGGRVGHTP